MILVPLFLASIAARGQSTDQPAALQANPKLAARLDPIRKDHDIPGMVGVILHGDRIVAIGAVGVRKHGNAEPFTIHDLVHIGSCTKAMTATRLARMVENEKLAWQTKLVETFPELKGQIDVGYENVTLEQLLTHRAGLPANWPFELFTGPASLEKKLEFARRMLKTAPEHQPGSHFEYSNVGYILAGMMAEKVLEKPYPELMHNGLFEPLGMRSAGFGPPGTRGKVDQPWGHRIINDKLVASQSDNVPPMSPAGRCHCTMADWAKFAVLHLQGAQGKARLLQPETFKKLHTPPPGEGYAYGWGINQSAQRGRVLAHSGSNTMWIARVRLFPDRDGGILFAQNCGGKEAGEAADAAEKALVEMFEKEYARRP
jgi:CubicO group peptidase (beta-lactamase class C family)